ncbi:MAG: response regulator, partial [Chloroflexota bacterium]|nr:response regulator [Chloroflexota bacterium]
MDARQTVLLVEDDVALSKLVSGLIEEAGFHPITIGDHAQIAGAVERWSPRCVILDGAVPTLGEGRSWNDAIAIRRAHPTIPVLMFSADAAAVAEANAGTTTRSRAAGFAGGVSKPFLIEEFLAKLRQAMPGATWPDATDEAAEPVIDDAISVFPDLTGTFASDAGRTDFVSAAVHELRAPLTVM